MIVILTYRDLFIKKLHFPSFILKFTFYFAFRACRCNPEGSKGINCNAIGQCECKENVVGLICDQCKAQHFDLDETNPKGCKQCFCYGHGVSCTALEGIGSRYIRSSFESDFEGWTVEDEFGKCRNMVCVLPVVSFCCLVIWYPNSQCFILRK